MTTKPSRTYLIELATKHTTELVTVNASELPDTYPQTPELYRVFKYIADSLPSYSLDMKVKEIK